MTTDVQLDLFQERCEEYDRSSEDLDLILGDNYSGLVSVYTDGSSSVTDTSFVGSSF